MLYAIAMGQIKSEERYSNTANNIRVFI